MKEEESILKQSLVLTAKLVGAFTVWTLLLTFVVVGLTSRAVLVPAFAACHRHACVEAAERDRAVPQFCTA